MPAIAAHLGSSFQHSMWELLVDPPSALLICKFHKIAMCPNMKDGILLDLHAGIGLLPLARDNAQRCETS
jgi:hypothetical protein